MKHSNISIFIPHNGCPCKCSFCNQNRITGVQKQPSPEEVRETIRESAEYMGERTSSAEIAFFGGSFTAIDRDYMLALLHEGSTGVEKYGFHGIRISTRPDKIDSEILSILKAHSVTAIELGAQSMDDRVLSLNDRGHGSDDVRRASAMIRAVNFELGLQMMTGLYGSSYEDDIYTASELIKLKPDTVRIYPTVTLENTKLADLYRSGEYIPPTLDESVRLCSELISMFEENNIRVIRVGLHATEEICGKRIAGAYHPAFKELCISETIYNELICMLRKQKKKDVTVSVNPKLISAFMGQKRSNIERIEKEGFILRIKQDNSVERFKITN